MVYKEVRDLMDFVNKTPNAYICVSNIKEYLRMLGYKELYENEDWSLVDPNGNYFVTKNDSSIIAFKLPGLKETSAFNIVATHSDSPSFRIKTNPDIFDKNYLKLNVIGYGGMINYSWLDRPLSIAGRIITKTDDYYESKMINVDKDLLLIPSQAIHLNREVNEHLQLNHQIDMLPVISLSDNIKLEDIIRTEIEKKGKVDKICDYDLYLYNRDKAKIIGSSGDLLLAPRLDDLGCVSTALDSFVSSSNNASVNVLAIFNHEEINSLTNQGADSTFLSDVLTRISKICEFNIYEGLNNSFFVSADNAQAIHPSASNKSDPTNIVKLNKGVVIKHHINYTTDALSSSIFKGILNDRHIPYQDYECRSDMVSGSTLGKINARHVSIPSIDIGLGQLAMHSANETIGVEDVEYMYQALLGFYNSSIIREKDKVRIHHH